VILGIIAAIQLSGCVRPPALPKPQPSEPFVTWDQQTTIPFLCYVVDQSKGPGHRAFLGLWDLGKGTISFQDSPLFSVGPQKSFASWDGGDRFAFSHTDVTQLDSRIRVDCVTEGTYYGSLVAAPSDSEATFAVYLEGQKPILVIKNHPLAGTIVMDPPELPPDTRLWRKLGTEISQERVNVYFETTRPDVDPASGKTDHVQGVIRAIYRPASTVHPVTWRVVNPEVPSYIAGLLRSAAERASAEQAVQHDRHA
jgi:hypothetical protein